MPRESGSDVFSQDVLNDLFGTSEDRGGDRGEVEDDGQFDDADDGSWDDEDGDGDSDDLGSEDDDEDLADDEDDEDDEDLGDDDEEGDWDDDGEGEEPRERKPKKESLREKAARADAWDDWAEKEKVKRYEEGLRATHDQQRREYDAEYQRELARLKAEQDRSSMKPSEFDAKYIQPLRDKRANWHSQFNQSANRVFAMKRYERELPGKVAELVKAMRLGPDAIDELVELKDPNRILAHAKRLQKRQAEIRKLKRQASQAQREGAAQVLSRRQPSPATGKGRGKANKDYEGSDAQLFELLGAGSSGRRSSGRRRR